MKNIAFLHRVGPFYQACLSFKGKKDYNKKAWSELLLKIRCNQLPSTVLYSYFVVALLGKKTIMHVVYSHSKVSQNYFCRVTSKCFLLLPSICVDGLQKFGMVFFEHFENLPRNSRFGYINRMVCCWFSMFNCTDCTVNV
jgi:hypothetical protein